MRPRFGCFISGQQPSLSTRVHPSAASQRGTIRPRRNRLRCGLRRAGTLREESERDAQFASRYDLPPPPGQRRFRHIEASPGERDLTRYRLFPAWLGSICAEPLEARPTASNTNTASVPLLVNDKSKPAAIAATN